MTLRQLSGILLLVALGLLVYAAYIPAKGWLSQQLLARAWQHRGTDGEVHRPWPGADMLPLAYLEQPRLQVGQVVLDGASGRALAFGPGLVSGSARPGRGGNIVLSGHRDTHFAWLAQLRGGDSLVLTAADGIPRRYAVIDLRVVHENDLSQLDPLAGDQLRLLTCYPFDGIAPGTPWRFAVTAYPMSL
ncbi:MAG: class GN sortase [Gammaproteobacteria bacterium]|nr:class GN sortase [Gammaproteobacteria bacterium]